MTRSAILSCTMAECKLGIVDPTSYANANEIILTDISLFLDVDFVRKVLSGRAELDCRRLTSNPSHLILDSRDLVIRGITSDSGESLNFTLNPPYKAFGSALSISIPKGENNSTLVVKIEYETSPNASGLQWLTPEQTLGKKEPFLLSQFQAIHARSAVPCQDTPAVRIRYKAEVSAPEQLTVLMSALHDGGPKPISGNRKLAKFNQPIPMPSYLIAFAVGRLTSRRISDRISVRAEPEAIEAAAYEFIDAEKTLATAESLCGPYEWGVYDLLVMPPSFPFGGMENPCLTFVTPTVLAGDRSLVDVVAHEISHSWSGNLVTSRTFEHFWLNEGWTVFIERKIAEKLHGSAERHFDATLGLNSLREVVEKTLGVDSEFTKLVPDLTDTDPDDAFSVVPYEKGHTFLFYLEELVGGADAFNPFIKAYFANFRDKSITTDDFRSFFTQYFKDKPEISKIDWETWLKGKGMPPILPEYDTSLTNASRDLATAWKTGPAGRSSADIKNLSSSQIILFLSDLLEGTPLKADVVRRMGELYPLDESRNSEIRFRWLRIGLKARAIEFVPKAFEFVNEQGRMKFVRPIYRDLYDWDSYGLDVREEAIDNFYKHRNSMMFVLSHQLLKDLHIIISK